MEAPAYLLWVFLGFQALTLANGWTWTDSTTMDPFAYSCYKSCGYGFGSCSCETSCQYLGNCCHDFNSYCSSTTEEPETTAASFSCMHNCGYYLGSCSCRYDCHYYGNCCYDYNSYCSSTTEEIATASSSCRYNCGYYLGSCSCRYDCHYYGNCCSDYNNYCSSATTEETATASPSCRYNCGYNLGSCSCRDNCRYYGNCCYDYDNYCSSATTEETATASPSCRYNCGYHLGSCSCRDNCRYYGNCCYDYNNYCSSATTEETATASPSCRYNCGYHLGSCSCRDNCRYYGNCCYDYDNYCLSATTEETATASPSCRYNCGYNLGSCSCRDNCRYYGNCCYDYNRYCPLYTTSWPDTTTDYYAECGGHLYGSGLFSSPSYPNYYYNNAYCVWYLSAQAGQRIFLSFADIQLENCCNCDYISVHDGSSTGYPVLGRICFNDTTHQTFHSSSQYLTVVFRSDSSVVSRGFKAQFTSSLTADQGRVDCSSDNMVIVIQRSYLNSLGLNGNDLYVDDNRCRPTINSTGVVFRFSLDTCGTSKEMMNGYVTYTNNVRASQSQWGEITRQSQFLLRVGCRMEPDTVVQILYKAKEDINATITGAGRFNASIAFYNSSSFNQQIYDSPYEVNLNQYMYVQVVLDRRDETLDLFLDTCVASPDPNDFKTRSYDLLRNGCARDSTYYSYINGQQYYARFRFQAFKFLRTHANVYLQCKVIICPGNDSNSRCSRGCQRRRRRSLESNYHTNTLILGPIKLKGVKPDLQELNLQETETGE
ncbi:scavenger receptor cysteine-rich domain-containing protein DMBT1 isoform X1 [Misgurnus anguillicaudatus]|uniref:scavenger receptor cysteine-rich domain-containing protein DMBT1 isoform X1 n=1 Tax=Misgurnus anguillicaudatus TaxID=75329 RepID=UPI003CCF6462